MCSRPNPAHRQTNRTKERTNGRQTKTITQLRLGGATRISHCGKKLTRLLFEFGVVKTMDDDCEQQIPSVALCL